MWCKKGGSRGYVTTRPLNWWIGKRNSGWLLTVPEGREFESSVPKSLHRFFPPDDPHFLKAACIHDYLIEAGYRRAFADSQWFEAALSEQAPELRARLAYHAMRLRLFAIWAIGRKRRK